MTPRNDALVDAAWLSDHSGDPDLRVIHVANDRAEYDAAHVRGAAYAHGYDDFTEDREFRALVPLPERMATSLGRLGVMSREVGDTAHRWVAAEGGVAAVLIVAVKPGGKGGGASCVAAVDADVGPLLEEPASLR